MVTHSPHASIKLMSDNRLKMQKDSSCGLELGEWEVFLLLAVSGAFGDLKKIKI